MFNSDFTMATNFPLQTVQTSCDLVINSVRASLLNFSIHETPYSLYLTIRKSLSKSPNQIFAQPQQHVEPDVQVRDLESLQSRLKLVENANLSLKENYEEAVNECEACHKQIKDLESKVKDLEQVVASTEERVGADLRKKDKNVELLLHDKQNLERELETAEKNWKTSNKNVKIKDKEIYDLKKEKDKVTENLAQVKLEYTNLKAKVNKEEKVQLKTIKKTERKEFIENLKSNSQPVKYDCNKCDVLMESLINLKNHERTFHMKSISSQTEEKVLEDKSMQLDVSEFSSDKSTQTRNENESEVINEVFKKYPCFYCGINIAGAFHLNEHRSKCRGTLNMFTLVGLPSLQSRFSAGFPPHQSRFSFR